MSAADGRCSASVVVVAPFVALLAAPLIAQDADHARGVVFAPDGP